MRYLLLVFVFWGLSVTGWSQTTYAPNSTSSMAGGSTYCKNVTPGLLTYTYNTCNSGTGTATGVPLTITWYSNTVNSTTGGTMQSITFVSSSTSATGNTTFLPSTFDVGTTYYYCVITWDGAGVCNTSGTLTSPTATVVVNTAPEAITGSTAACIGTITTLSNAVAGGTWSSNATARASINSSTGAVSAIAAGTATITYAVGACRSTTSFTVNSNPVAVAGTNSICENATTTFSDATVGGTWSIANPSVASINASSPVTITGLNSGTTTVTYTLGTTGCFATRALTVNNAPGTIAGTLSACVGTQSTLSNVEPGGIWTSTTTTRATITSGGVVSAVSAGTSVISYTIGSCRTTSTFTVNSNPVAVAGTNSICENATTTFSDATVGGTWSIADPSVASINASSPVTITGLNSGTTTVSYILGTGCYATRPLTVNNAPGTITGALSACAGTQSTLSNVEPGGTWTSATVTKATITAGGVVSAVASGTSVISYTIGTCRTTSTFTVNANPAAVAGTNVICENATTTFSDATASGIWSIADASVATIDASSPVTITGLNSGTTTVSYTLGTGCYATRLLTVNNAPGAITGTLSACVGAQSTLSNAEPGGTWVSATTTKATITTDGVVSAVSSGTSVISYSIGSCRSTATFTVNANPTAATGTNVICESATTTFSSTTVGGTWSITDLGVATISGSNTITITPIAAGTANLTYSLGTGCFVTRALTVNDAPAAITGTLFACPGGISTLSNTDPGGTWTSGTTARATITTDGIVTAVSAGTSTISYTIGSCRSTVVFTVNPNPAAITGTQTVCRNAVTTFSDVTAGGTWSTSNDAVASIDGTGPINITGESVGSATITYALPTGCFATRSVTVNQAPEAIVGSSSMCTGSTTTFTNAIAGGVWSSMTSTIASINASTGVSRGVAQGGTTISYSIGTCRALLPVTVEASPAAISGTASLCVGANITLTNAASFGTWSSGNPDVATINPANGMVTGVTAGLANITYSTGCGTDAVRVVTVNITPVAISGSLQACPGNVVSLTNDVAGGTWSGGVEGIATVTASGMLNAVAAGSTSISYTIGSCGVSANFTVNPDPASITGDNEICANGTTTFDNVDAGGTWSVADAGIATIDGETPTNIQGLIAGTTTISYTLPTGCFATRSLTVDPNPESIVGSAEVCQAASITLSSPTVGGLWSTSDTTVVSLDASSPVTVSGLSAGTAIVSYTLPTGCFTTANVTVNVKPSAAFVVANDACLNYSTTLVVSGTSGATITYKVDGGDDITAVLDGGSATINTGVINESHTYQLTNVQTASCATTLDTTAHIGVIPMQWVGGNFLHETEWNRPQNWSCGFVPGDTTNVTIPSGLTYYPELLDGEFAGVKNLTVQSGASVGLDNGAFLNIKGDMSNSGSFVGDGLVTLNGSSAQSITGLGSVNNLAINNASGVSIAAASRVTIIKSLTVTTGILSTSDSLVLYSDAVGNARVNALPASNSISGKVKVMQYVPGGYRRYRFWGHPLASDISLSQIQQYIDITGIGGAANGFTTTGSNNPSAFRYDPLTGNSSLGSDPGWKAYTKINSSAADSNLFHRYQGIRLFIRGTKGQGLGYVTETPNPVTIAVVGPLNQGSISIPLSKGSSANQEYNMVSNPYPAPVDLGTVAFNAKQVGNISGSAFYVWNPYLGVGGQFVTVPIGVGSASHYYIQANTSFQIRAAFNGATLSFSELNKGTTADAALLRPAPEYVTLNVVDADGHPWDMTRVAFNASATSATDDEYDATKLPVSDFGFYSLGTDGQPLSIDARPYSSDEVIPLGLHSNYAQQFTIRVDEANVPVGKQLFLNDKLLNKSIEVVVGAEYAFDITKDEATRGDNRFELSAKPASAITKAAIIALAPNPATDDVALTFSAPVAEKLSVRVMDVTGATVYAREEGVVDNAVVNISLKNLAPGTYMVEVAHGRTKSVQKLVKE